MQLQRKLKTHEKIIAKKKEQKHFDCVIKVQQNKFVGTRENTHTASIVASSTNHDVAALSVDVDFGVNTELELDPFTGEDVWGSGYPMLLLASRSNILSTTKGTLATKNIPVSRNAKKYGHFHRVTAQLYFGNSGGGIWSVDGKLIAIVSALVAGTSHEGMSVPIEGNYFVKPIQEVLTLLTSKGKYEEVFGDVK